MPNSKASPDDQLLDDDSTKNSETIFFRAGYGNLIWSILSWFARFITGGLATPFLDTYYYHRFTESIRINGKKLVLKAKLTDFIIIALMHYVLSGLSFGLWMFVADRVTARFVDSRLEWAGSGESYSEDELLQNPRDNLQRMANPQIVFFSARPLFFIDWLFYAVVILTLGFGYPLAMTQYYGMWVRNSNIDGTRPSFTGKPLEFFKLFIVDLILNLLTCGLWKCCGFPNKRMNKYLDKNIVM